MVCGVNHVRRGNGITTRPDREDLSEQSYSRFQPIPHRSPSVGTYRLGSFAIRRTINMRARQLVLVAMLGGLLGGGLAGCEQKGPAERAGEKLDEAAKDVKEGAEKAADKVEDAAQNLKDKVEDKK